MDYQTLIDSLVTADRSGLSRPSLPRGEIDTCNLLLDLAERKHWDAQDLQNAAFISRRMEIDKRLFAAYHANGRRIDNNELREIPWLELSAAIFLKHALIDRDDAAPWVRLKRFNALFRSLDVFLPEWMNPGSAMERELDLEWSSLLDGLPLPREQLARYPDSPQFDGVYQRDPRVHSVKTIPLTVLFYEGPIARAYLETLISLGLKPAKIVELISSTDLASGKSLGAWMPARIRKSYAATVNRGRIHYWPGRLKKSRPELVSSMLNEIRQQLGFSKATLDNANSMLPLTNYCDRLDSLLIENLSDKLLVQYLSQEPAGAILFTGGGLVPAAILQIPQLKILHLHPGYLPAIRGADCALWSVLLTGYFSATCFYLSAGIDTGEIVYPCWLPRLDIQGYTQDTELQTCYRAVYSFVDPWIRAYVLARVMKSGIDPNSFESRPQLEAEGTTFHFMHPRIQRAAFGRLFLR